MEKRTPLLSVVFGLLLISTFLECSEINREEQYTFNLALWTKVKTTSTCGAKPEVYCILTGAGKKKKRDQDCSICDKEHYYHTHPITYATDGSEKWWKSENYVHEVNITMDLGQEFFIAYVVLKMGRSPRPGNWILEKSVDFGRTYTPWQYFGMTESDCFHQYGVYEKRSASTEDEVLCSTEYSSILPLEYGEIHLNLLKGRPGAETFYSNKKLQKWAKATNIRLRLQKIRTLNADLMMISNHDTTVTRRYFYSIRDISIGGRCVCYGHADRCLRNTNTGNLECRCLHNTCGPSCMQCCPGFNQFPWQPTTPKENNTCQACHCFNHASHCYYNGNVAKNKLSLNINGQFEGGGVCVNCQHNTVGVNCNECKPGMYRPFKKSHYDWDACKDCNCNANGSLDSVCNNVGGRCKCTTGVTGQKCDRCEIGLWNFPNCRDCECHVIGSYTEQCDPKNGTCRCKPGVGGRNCQICTSRSLKYPGISLLTDMGCLPCDDCTMTLINESMSLTNKTMIEITDLKTYDIMDFFTIKISNSWQNIWDYEDFMEALLEGTDSLTREPLVYEFNILVNVEERYAMYVENSAKQVRKKAGLISNYAKELHHDTQQVIMKSRQVTNKIKDALEVLQKLDKEENKDHSSMEYESIRIIKDMKKFFNWPDHWKNVINEKKAANVLYQNIVGNDVRQLSVNRSLIRLGLYLKSAFSDFEEKMDDIRDNLEFVTWTKFDLHYDLDNIQDKYRSIFKELKNYNGTINLTQTAEQRNSETLQQFQKLNNSLKSTDYIINVLKDELFWIEETRQGIKYYPTIVQNRLKSLYNELNNAKSVLSDYVLQPKFRNEVFKRFDDIKDTISNTFETLELVKEALKLVYEIISVSHYKDASKILLQKAKSIYRHLPKRQEASTSPSPSLQTNEKLPESGQKQRFFITHETNFQKTTKTPVKINSTNLSSVPSANYSGDEVVKTESITVGNEGEKTEDESIIDNSSGFGENFDDDDTSFTNESQNANDVDLIIDESIPEDFMTDSDELELNPKTNPTIAPTDFRNAENISPTELDELEPTPKPETTIAEKELLTSNNSDILTTKPAKSFFGNIFGRLFGDQPASDDSHRESLLEQAKVVKRSSKEIHAFIEQKLKNLEAERNKYLLENYMMSCTANKIRKLVDICGSFKKQITMMNDAFNETREQLKQCLPEKILTECGKSIRTANDVADRCHNLRRKSQEMRLNDQVINSDQKTAHESVNDTMLWIQKVKSQALKLNLQRHRNLRDEIIHKMDRLRSKIHRASSVASKLKVPYHFSGPGFVKLNINRTLLQSSLTTEIRLSLKPEYENGIILNLGNETKPQDTFIGLELVEGKAKVSLKSKFHDDIELMHSERIPPHKWITLSINRIGRTVSLVIVHNDGKEVSRSVTLPEGTPLVSSLLNGPFFVGGLPRDMGIRRIPDYTGCISDLIINGHEMSMFGSTRAEGFQELCTDDFFSPESRVSRQISFGGKGYLSMSTDTLRRINPFLLEVKFSTTEPNGTIFFISEVTEHVQLIVYMINGHVVCKYSDQPIPAKSQRNIYNNGQWHSLKVFRNKHVSQVKLDGADRRTVKSLNWQYGEHIDMFFVGGVPDGITKTPWNRPISFRGCMADLKINRRPRELTNFLRAYDVTFNGCRIKWLSKRACLKRSSNLLRGLTFHPKTKFISNICFSVKTNSSFATIMAYFTSMYKRMALSIVDGRTILNYTNVVGKYVIVEVGRTLNDGMWHNLVIYVTTNRTTLLVDDIKVSAPVQLSSIMHSSQHSIHLGYLPNARLDYINPYDKLCYKDVIINERLLDVAGKYSRKKEIQLI